MRRVGWRGASNGSIRSNRAIMPREYEMTQEDAERVDRFQAAWKEFTTLDRMYALEWIQAGVPGVRAIDEAAAERLAKAWEDPS